MLLFLCSIAVSREGLKIVHQDSDYGVLYNNLKEVMDKEKVSISKMSKLSGVKYDVVKRYYYDKIYKFDRVIMSKFCYVLKCDLSDVVCYRKPVKSKKKAYLISLK